MELASRVDGKLLACCLEKPWASSLKLYHNMDPLLQKLEGEYKSDPAIYGALGKHRDSLLLAHILDEFLQITKHEVGRALARGMASSQLEGILSIYKEVALDLSRQQGLPLSSYYKNFVISEIGILNLDFHIRVADYGRNKKLKRQLLWRRKPPFVLSSAWMVLVVEGHDDLI
jgi:hypothetical protein